MKSHFQQLLVKISCSVSYKKPNTVLCQNTGETYKLLGDGFNCQSFFDGLSFSGFAWILKLLPTQNVACVVMHKYILEASIWSYTTMKASKRCIKLLWQAICICKNVDKFLPDTHHHINRWHRHQHTWIRGTGLLICTVYFLYQCVSTLQRQTPVPINALPVQKNLRVD